MISRSFRFRVTLLFGLLVLAVVGALAYELGTLLTRQALHERGESDKARYVAARLKEFRSPQAAEFFAPCEVGAPALAATLDATPFQCLAPTRPLTFEDFR